MAPRDVSERRDRKREAQAERERDPEGADRAAPDVDRDGDRVEPEEEEENVPSASAARRKPRVDESISSTSFEDGVRLRPAGEDIVTEDADALPRQAHARIFPRASDGLVGERAFDSQAEPGWR
jgi:hypothetical protein